MRPSISLIISCVFILFISHSIYNLISLYKAPVCKENEECYPSYLNKNPNLELFVYISHVLKHSESKLVFHLKDFKYREPFEREIEIYIPIETRYNGSLFIHSVIIPERKSKTSPSLSDLLHSLDGVYLKSRLSKYAVPKSSTFNLLQEEAVKQSIKPVAHLKTKYAITMCTDNLNIPRYSVPMEIYKLIRINRNGEFLPIAMQDVLQTRLKDLEEITPDAHRMNFTYMYSGTSIGRFKFLVQMESTFHNFIDLGFTAKDVDEVKGVFADTNLYLLCATMVVGGIHLLLDFLSFKNDVSFWKSHKSMAGLSIRTVLWRSFSQTVVFLFLLDEGTSLLVLIPTGIGMFIEFWKITKVFKITVSWSGFTFDRNIQETEAEANTRKYDEESMKYLNYLLYPLILSAAVYSLIYQSHKSFYSWTINSLVNGVYVFGFIFMLPQLFINYRLKSVAALPWRAFTYRAFNTFIDDIFAFIITMPTAHRLACFRDDVVFIIYLYQRWLYPVDKTRVDDSMGESIEPVGESIETVEEKKTK